MTASGTGSLFEPADDTTWVATELARGPWDPRHCHGGPVSALLARAVEQVEAPATEHVDWQIARLTVELTRAVPVGEPLTVSTVVERPGRKVSLVAATLSVGDTEVAKVRSLRIRTQEMELPSETVHPPVDPPGTAAAGHRVDVMWGTDGGAAFHTHGSEHRFTEGRWDTPGPVAVWIRLLVEVVPGESPSGVQRVAAAADFGNGVSGGLDSTRFVYINPDLTIHLLRPPIGEWVGMRSASYYGLADRCDGAGMAESALYDERGRLGRSVQSLFIDER